MKEKKTTKKLLKLSSTFTLIYRWEVRGGVNLVIKQEFSTMELMGGHVTTNIAGQAHIMALKVINMDIVWQHSQLY